MYKKLISILFTIVVIVAIFILSTISSSAYSGEITFKSPDERWTQSNTIVSAHLWNSITNDYVTEYIGSSKERMTKVDDLTYTYNVPEGDWNMIIIFVNSGYQTYDCTIGPECIGDTIYVTGEKVNNPANAASQKCSVATWKKNNQYGPHKTVSYTGEIIGTSLANGETDELIYKNWIINFNPAEELKKSVQEKLNLLPTTPATTIAPTDTPSVVSDIPVQSDSNNSNIIIIMFFSILILAVIFLITVIIILNHKK